MKDAVAVASAAAKEAGIFVWQHFGAIGEVTAKSDRSLVTNLDRESESLIVKRIRASFPNHVILAEEGSVGAAQGEYRWIIDPLDGTHNFVRNVAVFGVSIGIMRGEEFVAGVIYMPAEDGLYQAEKGMGAFRNGVRIAVSSTPRLEGCSITYDSSIRANRTLATEVLGELGSSVFNVRIYGCSVRNLTYLAEGKTDAAFEFDEKPWDFAAGVCLVTEAGGAFTTNRGEPMTLKDKGYIASNGRVHREALALVGKYLK